MRLDELKKIRQHLDIKLTGNLYHACMKLMVQFCPVGKDDPKTDANIKAINVPIGIINFDRFIF